MKKEMAAEEDCDYDKEEGRKTMDKNHLNDEIKEPISGKISVSDKLPTKKGDVVIMTIKQLYETLKGKDGNDPTSGYNESTYHVYGICDGGGSTEEENGSTLENLRKIEAEWYKRLNKPTTYNQKWHENDHKVFGGPLNDVFYNSSFGCLFRWWYGTSSYFSGSSDHWGGYVDGSSVYVAVVRAK